MNKKFNCFSLFTLFSTTSGRVIFAFCVARHLTDLRPILAPSVGAVTLVYLDLDFEVVANADAVGS